MHNAALTLGGEYVPGLNNSPSCFSSSLRLRYLDLITCLAIFVLLGAAEAGKRRSVVWAGAGMRRDGMGSCPGIYTLSVR